MPPSEKPLEWRLRLAGRLVEEVVLLRRRGALPVKDARCLHGSRGPNHRARVVGLLAAAEVALRHGLGFLRINAKIFFLSDTARRNAPSNEIENLWAALEKNLAT